MIVNKKCINPKNNVHIQAKFNNVCLKAIRIESNYYFLNTNQTVDLPRERDDD